MELKLWIYIFIFLASFNSSTCIECNKSPVFTSFSAGAIDLSNPKCEDVFGAQSFTDNENDKITCAIEAQSPNGAFTLETDTGSCYLKCDATVISNAPFDADYTINIRISDGCNTVTTGDLTLKVENRPDPPVDSNRNAPVFQKLPYKTSVLRVGGDSDPIFTLTVTDDDTGPAGNVTVSIENTDYVPFGVAELEGGFYINVISEISPNISSPYILELKAVDGGTPPKSSSAAITIALKSRPKILDPKDSDTLLMCETTAANTEVYNLNITDDDTVKASLTVTVHDQVPLTATPLFTVDEFVLKTSQDLKNGTFDIDETGSITNYSITVSVTDADGYSDSVTITLKLEDDNDNPPVFDNGTDRVAHALQGIQGEELFSASATDKDRDAPNNAITYELSGVGSDNFTVSTTGMVSVSGEANLDYASKTSYNLILTAYDGLNKDENSASVLVKIEVDTPPVLNAADIIMPENTAPGDIVASVSANDHDGEEKGTNLTYFVTDVPSWLTIDENHIKVKADADGDMYNADPTNADLNYEFTVGVTDGTYNDSTTVTLTITDVNDNTPIFQNTPYERTIHNKMPIGSTVVTVTATDDDRTSPNNEITYSLSGNGTEIFQLEGRDVVTKDSVTYSPTGYVLIVTATDNATESKRNSSTVVTITVNALPEFVDLFEPGEITIPEDDAVGKSIYTVLGTDQDSDNEDLVVDIVSQEPAMPVTFGLEGSVLKISEALDAESVTEYSIVFNVSDGLYTTTSSALTVLIKDVNDNSPIFSGNTTRKISETHNLGSEVVQVTAVDADATDEFNIINYSIESGNDHGVFILNSSDGNLTLAKEPKLSSYTIVVKAYDNGSPPNTAIANVIITIESDINDCSPDPCKHDGICLDGINSYSCNCSEGWKGQNCTEACGGSKHGRNCAQTCSCNNDTHLSSSAVANDQKCNRTTGACHCNNNWMGDGCDSDVDECITGNTLCNAAENRVCWNTDGSYECICETGFIAATGGNCTEVPMSTQRPLEDGEIRLEVGMQVQSQCEPEQLKIPEVYTATKASIEKMLDPLKPKNTTETLVSNIRCGSIDFDAEFIFDNSEDTVILAVELQKVRHGETQLVYRNKTVATVAINVSDKELLNDSKLDPAAQLCEVYNLLNPCSNTREECRVENGKPSCKFIPEVTDHTSLILGLGLGTTLPLLVLLICFVCCWYNTWQTKKQRKRSEPGYSSSGRLSDRTMEMQYDNAGFRPYSSRVLRGSAQFYDPTLPTKLRYSNSRY